MEGRANWAVGGVHDIGPSNEWLRDIREAGRVILETHYSIIIDLQNLSLTVPDNQSLMTIPLFL